MSGLIRPSSVGPNEEKVLGFALDGSRKPLVTASVAEPTVMTFLASAS